VFYVDGLEYLINMYKRWISVAEDSSQNIVNITDENGNILAYFDANGIFHANITNIDEFQIHIPPVINSYVGDVLQLFKYPITLLGDYSNYGVNLSVATTDNNVKKQGRDLRRYFQFTPTAVGEYNIHVNVMDTRQQRMLAENTMKINVLTPTNPSSVKNILCVGDSEVEGYVNNSGITAADGSTTSSRSPWTNELKALMTTSRAATNVLPAGLGLTNIHLIGTRNTSGGRHEGYGGKSADFFLGNTPSNPFYVGGSVDFNAYLAQNSVYDDTSHKGVDIMYIMLGGNNASEITRNGNKLVITKPTAKTQMIALLNAINTQLRTNPSKAYYNPNLKVVLLNYYSPWIEGYGYHPYGSGRYTDNCWTALGFYVCYQINNEIAAMDEYKDWVSSVMLSTQVDSENAFVYINKQKNVYMSETEIASLEAVHPNSIGYKMLGAAVMRDLLGRI
jgi:lysophospholipase L1-like esterase